MEDLDTFLTLLYVMVDDLCKQHGLSMPTHPGPAPKLSLSELITLALFGQWARFPSERAFYRFAQRHLKAAFPMLPDHSQFVRGEHACAQLIEQMACLASTVPSRRPVSDPGCHWRPRSLYQTTRRRLVGWRC